MNIGRSLRVALAKKDMTQKDLAAAMACSGAYINKLAKQEHAGMGAVKRLADYFGMQVSDFVKLGED